MSHEIRGRILTAIITGAFAVFVTASSFYHTTQSDVSYLKIVQLKHNDTLQVHELRINKHETDIAVINAKLDHILRGIEEIKKQIK
jgi:hypothetical protein